MNGTVQLSGGGDNTFLWECEIASYFEILNFARRADNRSCYPLLLCRVRERLKKCHAIKDVAEFLATHFVFPHLTSHKRGKKAMGNPIDALAPVGMVSSIAGSKH